MPCRQPSPQFPIPRRGRRGVTATVGVGLGLALAVGCSGLPRPIEDPAERFAFSAGTVLPPSSGPWQLSQQQDDVLVFFRGTASEDHVVFAQAAVLPQRFGDLESYRRHLEGSVRPDANRFEEIHTEFRVVPGAPGYVRGELRMQQRATGVGTPLRMENRSRGYLDPEGGQVILSVTQRYPVGAQPLDLGPEVEAFLDSLVLADRSGG